MLKHGCFVFISQSRVVIVYSGISKHFLEMPQSEKIMKVVEGDASIYI